jgi:hypothetical protein
VGLQYGDLSAAIVILNLLTIKFSIVPSDRHLLLADCLSLCLD